MIWLDLSIEMNFKSKDMHSPILLFDFDGTIITQKALEYTALYYLKKKWYSWQNVEGLRLIDFARFFEESGAQEGIEAIKMISDSYKPYIPNRFKRFLFFAKFARRYRIFEKKYEQLKPDITETLTEFKNRGYPMGIVSNTGKKRLNYFRKKFDLDDFFAVYVTRDDVPLKKPHPYPIILTLKLIKDKYNFKSIDKNKVYFIGDLPLDIYSAKAAKINSIAVLTGHGRKEQLIESNPTYIINTLTELSELI